MDELNKLAERCAILERRVAKLEGRGRTITVEKQILPGALEAIETERRAQAQRSEG